MILYYISSCNVRVLAENLADGGGDQGVVEIRGDYVLYVVETMYLTCGVFIFTVR